MSAGGAGATTVSGKNVFTKSEFIGSIRSTNGIWAFAQKVNPANRVVFPWLSQIARAYTKFKIIKLIFRYIPASSTFTSGWVGFVPDFNTDANLPYTKDALNIYKSKVAQPYKEFSTSFTARDFKNFAEYFVDDPSTNSDPKTYFPLGFYVFTDTDVEAGITLGQLWVDYSIELFEPYVYTIADLGYEVSLYFNNIQASIDVNANMLTGGTGEIGGLPIRLLQPSDPTNVTPGTCFVADVDLRVWFVVAITGSEFGDVTGITYNSFGTFSVEAIGFYGPVPEVVNDGFFSYGAALVIKQGTQFYPYCLSSTGTASNVSIWICLYNPQNDPIPALPMLSLKNAQTRKTKGGYESNVIMEKICRKKEGGEFKEISEEKIFSVPKSVHSWSFLDLKTLTPKSSNHESLNFKSL